MGEARRKAEAYAAGEPRPRPNRCPACLSCSAIWEALPSLYVEDPVCAEPCDNCAFRPGSPEQRDTAERLTRLPNWPAALNIGLAAQYVSLSPTSIYALVKDNRFPQPIHLTPGRLGWRRTDLDRWVAQGGVDGWQGARATLTEANPWD
jgi:prophage regulatory protein